MILTKLRKSPITNYEIRGISFKRHPRVIVIALFRTTGGLIAINDGSKMKLPSTEMGQNEAFPDVLDRLTCHLFDASMGVASSVPRQLPTVHGCIGNEGETLHFVLSLSVKEVLLARRDSLGKLVRVSSLDSPEVDTYLMDIIGQESTQLQAA
jgi:hypothetical protein